MQNVMSALTPKADIVRELVAVVALEGSVLDADGAGRRYAKRF